MTVPHTILRLLQMTIPSEQPEKRKAKIPFSKLCASSTCSSRSQVRNGLTVAHCLKGKSEVLWRDQQRRTEKGESIETTWKEDTIRSPCRSISSEPITENSLGIKSKFICLSTKRSSISPASNFTPRVKKSASNRLL